jgi:hypothetical protein
MFIVQNFFYLYSAKHIFYQVIFVPLFFKAFHPIHSTSPVGMNNINKQRIRYEPKNGSFQANTQQQSKPKGIKPPLKKLRFIKTQEEQEASD